MKRTGVAVIAALTVLGMLAGCRSQGGGTGDLELKTDFGVTSEPCPDAVDEGAPATPKNPLLRRRRSQRLGHRLP